MIPLSKPFLGKEEEQAVIKALQSGWITQGPRVQSFEELLGCIVNARFACAVSSCTAALHLALMAVGVKPGDIVITVSHSFIATANCVRHCYAEPVFIDVNPQTFNMDPSSLRLFLENQCVVKEGSLYLKEIKRLIGDNLMSGCIREEQVGRISAIMPVHQMGMPCEIFEICSIASDYNLPVVEDAACALGSEIFVDGSWEKIGKPHGHVACFSFHPRKIITTGEGGVIVTNFEEIDKKVRILRHHGMMISDRMRHNSQVLLKESYQGTGFNYRMSDINAAVGIEQLKKLSVIVKERRQIVSQYNKLLENVKWLVPQAEPASVRSNYQSYGMLLKKDAPVSRDDLIRKLLENGVSARVGIMNAHKEPVYKNHNYNLPESDDIYERMILLPIFNGMTASDLDIIRNVIFSSGEILF